MNSPPSTPWIPASCPTYGTRTESGRVLAGSILPQPNFSLVVASLRFQAMAKWSFTTDIRRKAATVPLPPRGVGRRSNILNRILYSSIRLRPINPTRESVPAGLGGSQVDPTSFANRRRDSVHPISLAVHSGVMRRSIAHPSKTSAKWIICRCPSSSRRSFDQRCSAA